MTTIQRTLDMFAEFNFRYDGEKVDPFYWINPDTNEKQWRMEGIYSDITTEDGIWQHLAYNAVVNGVYDASRLDGWADLERDELTISFDLFIDGISA